ncbi:zinc-binding dehydrogenase [Biscogniauxia marginata]|nr:zinc-binding dehydrogenase [Biscogniauxia marginata]
MSLRPTGPALVDFQNTLRISYYHLFTSSYTKPRNPKVGFFFRGKGLIATYSFNPSPTRFHALRSSQFEMTSTMKALVTKEGHAASIQETEIPRPGEGEILVKVNYVAQNPTDWKAVAASPPGRIVGCDFAGVIADENASHWVKGQRVAGFVQGTSTKPLRGVFAEYAIIESSLVYPIPDGITDQQAVVIPLAFATAAQAMFQRLKLPEPAKPAKNPFPFLVNGGTSSVGQYAIQLGKLAGLFVVATGSKKNHDLLKFLGADATVDYNDSDWVEQISKVTHDGLGYALDCISEKGTVQSIAKTLSPTKGGHIMTLLPVAGIRDSGEIENKKVKLESTLVYTVFERPLQYGAFDNIGGATPEDKAFWEKYLSLLPDLLSSGKIKPNIFRERGSINDILRGFKEHEEGKVSAEKLVYSIA